MTREERDTFDCGDLSCDCILSRKPPQNSRTRSNNFSLRHSPFVALVLVALVLGAVEANPIAVATPGDETRTIQTIMERHVAFFAKQKSPLIVTAATNRARACIHDVVLWF